MSTTLQTHAARALDQLDTLLASVTPERLDAQTPCEKWSMRDLGDHIAHTTSNFVRAMNGEDVDFSSTAPRDENWLATFRQHADDLRKAWQEADARPEQLAEFTVHGWDVAHTLGRPTDALDQDVAEHALEILQGALTPDTRGSAFQPELPAPEGADVYTRLAAFAGRVVT